MVIRFPLVLIAFNERFTKVQAFWASLALGLFVDLLTLSLPLGFFSILYPLTILLWCFLRPYVPKIWSVKAFPFIFLISFSYALIECSLLTTFHHPIEDLLLGPLFDTSLFAIIVLLSKWLTQPKKGLENETE